VWGFTKLVTRCPMGASFHPTVQCNGGKEKTERGGASPITFVPSGKVVVLCGPTSTEKNENNVGGGGGSQKEKTWGLVEV